MEWKEARKTEITIGSLFDGIGGFPLAGNRCGIKTLWASEIEPFPIKVTKTRFPDMKHLGDIAKINGAEIDPVDIITFGSPCQDLSVAGKRAGLAGERSGLFMEAVRIIKEMRSTYAGTNEPIRPRFAVWENVPGAFSSNKGEDFRAVLEELCRVKDETVIIPGPPKGKWNTVGAIMGNGWSIAWRILDAQYWGVPQRRRRIYLVADFGGQSAPEILFKREGLSRHSQESGEARKGIAADVKRGIGKTIADVMPFNTTQITSPQNGNRVEWGLPCHCLNSTDHPPAAVIKAYGICSYASNSMKSSNPYSGIYEAETSRTIDLNGGSPACNQGGMAIVQALHDPSCPLDSSYYKGCGERNGVERNVVATYQKVTGPLMANSHPGSYTGQDAHSDMFVAGLDIRNLNENGDISGTLQSKKTGGYSLNYTHPVRQQYSVRRLTPLECERLQGFPDGWTDIPGQTEATKEELGFWRDVWFTWDKVEAEEPEKVKPRTDKAILKWLKNPVSDSAQYKALGNSVAVPCPEYVLEGIKEVLEVAHEK